MMDSKVSVHVPKRSWRPLKKHNRLTGKCGTLVPVFSAEVIPGTKVFIRQTLGVTLPPLVSDTYMSVSYKTEAFFVPSRILFGGAEDWFTQDAAPSISAPVNAGDDGVVVDNIPQLPVWSLNLSSSSGPGPDSAAIGPGTLADYLGVRAESDSLTGSSAFLLNPLPFLAYHMIYEWYYRAPLIQNHVFARPSGKGPLINSGCDYLPAMMPYIHDGYTIVGSAYSDPSNQSCLADDVSIDDLRQRNFGFDYFTQAYPSNPGDNISVQISNGAFSINSLRAANSLTLFSERNMIAGKRLVDVVAARYGADLSNGVTQMPICLGSANYEVYNRSVSITANGVVTTDGGNQPIGKNPYSGNAGASMGNGFAGGTDNIVDGFECNEHGYIMIIGSLVPRACYGSGVRRYLKRYTTGGSASITELANPLLQNVGYDVIKSEELDAEVAAVQSGSIFGYTEKFASFFNFEDEVHGIFRDGGSLSAFVLQRNFKDANNPVHISSNFLEIPTTYMDDITIVNSAMSEYGYELDYYVEGGFMVPLYKHSTPSLQDPAVEHGKSVVVHRGGFRF